MKKLLLLSLLLISIRVKAQTEDTIRLLDTPLTGKVSIDTTSFATIRNLASATTFFSSTSGVTFIGPQSIAPDTVYYNITKTVHIKDKESYRPFLQGILIGCFIGIFLVYFALKKAKK